MCRNLQYTYSEMCTAFYVYQMEAYLMRQPLLSLCTFVPETLAQDVKIIMHLNIYISLVKAYSRLRNIIPKN